MPTVDAERLAEVTLKFTDALRKKGRSKITLDQLEGFIRRLLKEEIPDIELEAKRKE